MHKVKVALLLLALPCPLAAQNSQSDSSKRAARELDTVAVHARKQPEKGYVVRSITSATKTNLPLRDIPQSVTVIPATLLSDQAVQSMAEVARFIPGVTFGQGEGHRDAPTIRGNSSTADFFQDGVRDDSEYYRDIYNIERIEGLKGSNAMAFGRGGGGGVINRVTKTADWMRRRSLAAEGGSFGHKRTTLDLADGFGPMFSVRLNAMAENSGSFRASTSLTRRGVNPTATLLLKGNVVRAGYEYLLDDRTVNRGIPSYQGAPSSAAIETFFGDPDVSRAWLYAHNANLVIERESPERFSLRNRTVFSTYDKLYQNVLPGAVTADGSQVTLTGYRSSHDRTNLFNQTDLVVISGDSALRHTMLVGAEIGRQNTDNFRETGFFGTATSLRVPFGSPTVRSGVAFKQSASDADNNVRASNAAIYAQEQVAIGSHIQAIAGVRGEQFEIDFRNHRNAQKLSRTDVMVSPRIGLTLKPVPQMSLYASASVSHLPGSGDQFSSLTATTQTLEPEEFRNREVGFKWDLLPALSFAAALYNLDRSNTAAPDPADPSRQVQTGKQESSGFETNISGNLSNRWQVFAGFTAQRAEIVSQTRSSRAGATVPMVPSRTGSLWSRFDLTPRLAVGLGMVAQSKMFAAIDNTVSLPGFARGDAALYFTPLRNLRVQANVENLFNVRYYTNSHGNNNIMPGAPRTLRVSLSAF